MRLGPKGTVRVTVVVKYENPFAYFNGIAPHRQSTCGGGSPEMTASNFSDEPADSFTSIRLRLSMCGATATIETVRGESSLALYYRADDNFVPGRFNARRSGRFSNGNNVRRPSYASDFLFIKRPGGERCRAIGYNVLVRVIAGNYYDYGPGIPIGRRNVNGNARPTDVLTKPVGHTHSIAVWLRSWRTAGSARFGPICSRRSRGTDIRSLPPNRLPFLGAVR